MKWRERGRERAREGERDQDEGDKRFGDERFVVTVREAAALVVPTMHQLHKTALRPVQSIYQVEKASSRKWAQAGCAPNRLTHSSSRALYDLLIMAPRHACARFILTGIITHHMTIRRNNIVPIPTRSLTTRPCLSHTRPPLTHHKTMPHSQMTSAHSSHDHPHDQPHSVSHRLTNPE